MRIRIRATNWMRIHADPDPKHWLVRYRYLMYGWYSYLTGRLGPSRCTGWWVAWRGRVGIIPKTRAVAAPNMRGCSYSKHDFYQGCGSGLIYYGSGSSIFAQSESGSKLKQNFRRQFLSQICLKSKFESNQIKNTCVIHHKFFQKVLSAILYFFTKSLNPDPDPQPWFVHNIFVTWRAFRETFMVAKIKVTPMLWT
jgi:hypothetical protein